MSTIAANKQRASHISGADAGNAGKDKVDLVDFKMVTFSLAGKDYGIDIMKVKEIARFVNFTYVPNTPNYVRGVYNLRGDIISIIDLRAMFNLPFKQKSSTEEESGLIIRLDTTLIGVIVDKIDKVVGISSKNIQPPHPIFGDINIKFISGVVENDGRLYIILDADKVLGKPEERSTPVAAITAYGQSAPSVRPVDESDPRARNQTGSVGEQDQNKVFIKEALHALLGFTVNGLNETWFDQRYAEWEAGRKGNQVQIKSQDEAKQFLENFYSPFTAQLWSKDYLEAVMAMMPEKVGSHINIWNPGCGRGYETYSLAVALRKKYPEARMKIWASDKDLLNVSSAPNLVFADREIPEYFDEFMVEGKNGKSFNPKIKESILFEYHDMVNDHTLPPLDIVFSRDVFSFQSNESQRIVMQALDDMVKPGGVIILGQNEVYPESDKWTVKEFQLMHVARHE